MSEQEDLTPQRLHEYLRRGRVKHITTRLFQEKLKFFLIIMHERCLWYERDHVLCLFACAISSTEETY